MQDVVAAGSVPGSREIAEEPGASTRVVAAPAPSPLTALAYISYLRVAAIVGVVAIHSLGLTVDNRAHVSRGAYQFTSAVETAVSWCVPVFVMISGALLLPDVPGESMGAFYRRRLRRIGVAAIFWNAWYFAFRGVVLHKPIDPMRIARDLMLAKTYTALYFFPLIIGLYVITPILRPFFARATRREAWFAGGLILAACLAYPVIGQVAALQKVGVVNAPLNSLTYFLPSVGVYIAGYLLRDVRLSRRGVVLALLAVVAATAELMWQDLHPGRLHGWLDALMPSGMGGLQCTVVSLCLFLLARTLIRPGTRLATPAAARRARVLGDLTLGVFVIHLTVRYIVQKAVPGWTDGGTTIPASLELTGLVLVGAFAVAWAFMKTPVLRKTIGG